MTKMDRRKPDWQNFSRADEASKCAVCGNALGDDAKTVRTDSGEVQVRPGCYDKIKAAGDSGVARADGTKLYADADRRPYLVKFLNESGKEMVRRFKTRDEAEQFLSTLSKRAKGYLEVDLRAGETGY